MLLQHREKTCGGSPGSMTVFRVHAKTLRGLIRLDGTGQDDGSLVRLVTVPPGMDVTEALAQLDGFNG
jgi:hypothetical protein